MNANTNVTVINTSRPQLIISVYGLDTFGNDVVRGYGVCHLPVVNGQSSEEMIMFVPESSSTLQKLTSWLTGKRPEYVDARLLARGDGREGIKYILSSTIIMFLRIHFFYNDLKFRCFIFY
uniref:B9 domain-containing protein 1 n=1 Tax=Melanaphis sacchari TaxID=742174 RepID=A0A2H8THY3_9HEMI